VNIETKGYKKIEDSENEIHGPSNRTQFIGPQKKLRYFRITVDLIERKLAQYKQK
jgi:hypothetical protein